MRFLSILAVAVITYPSLGQDENKQEGEKPLEQVLAGHSVHGEAFNEGPRQAAYLMHNIGHIDFPVTSASEEAAEFVEQGVAQIHGFWYFEAERSFRQAAMLDPDCAMAYWGMAMANINNEKRAKGFINQALKLKTKATRREQLYIDATNGYITADRSKRKTRAEKYISALERLLYEFPDDLDAKAFLALQMWSARSGGVKINSHLAIDALLGDVFDKNPMHPAHHYRIHLWNYHRDKEALKSAALCGQAAPGIAHMWHMPGHIFSRLKRYNDAAWQQEASARVDHAHMMRDRVLPDQISNFAHNNEWLIRNLIHVGRVNDAVDLAKNMIELPRHPKYNSLTKRGSYNYGRMRLFQILSTYEMWDEIIKYSSTPYLEPTDKSSEQTKRERYLAAAYYQKGDTAKGDETLTTLRKRLDAEKKKKSDAEKTAEKSAREAAAKAAQEKVKKAEAEKLKADKAKADKAKADKEKAAKESSDKKAEVPTKDGKPPEKKEVETIKPACQEPKKDAKPQDTEVKSESKPKTQDSKELKSKIDKARKDAARSFSRTIRDIEKAISAVEGHQAIAAGDHKKANTLLKKAGGVNKTFQLQTQFNSGEQDEAIKSLKQFISSHAQEVQPLAVLIDMLWRAGKKDEAKKRFQELREISGPVDIDKPPFVRLNPIVTELQLEKDWRIFKETKNDVGDRPPLDSLGPFRWAPQDALPWTLQDQDGVDRSLADFKGKPVVVIFYLGYECLHCAEQLEAFAPKAQEFEQAGLKLVAVSTDEMDGLKKSVENYDGTGLFPIPLVSDPNLEIFKSYRAYDDFEKQPLHGTFLIDEEGKVRWQDISFEPFMDPSFVLNEYKRLLGRDSQ